jgi:hypothetical protein
MSWAKILTKNNKEFQKEIPKKNKVEIIIEETYIDPNMKDYNDEFDFNYESNIIEIKIEFKKYINDQCLPFLDKNLFSETNGNIFYDFIKYNSKNYIDLKNKIEKENEDYLRELEEEEQNDILENEEH